MLSSKQIYDRLITAYGQPDWWPGTPYVIMVTAILVQNTAWRNVEKTVAEMDERLAPEYIDSLTEEELQPLIRSCGFYRAKARYVKAMTAWFKGYGYEVGRVRENPCMMCGRSCWPCRALVQRRQMSFYPMLSACHPSCWMPIQGGSWNGSVTASRQTRNGGRF